MKHPIRLPANRENLVVMLDLFCSCIETRLFPSINSDAHRMLRWLVDDSGHKPKRKRTRLKHRKPEITASASDHPQQASTGPNPSASSCASHRHA